MTHSTKQALVEHVAEAIANEYFRDPVAVFDFHALDLNLQDEYRAMAKAAIRATLEWARDNVSEEVVAAGEKAVDSPFYVGIEVQYRAMLSALIRELDKGDGG